MIADFSPGITNLGSAIDLLDCNGDGNAADEVDLIVDVRGDGRTYGIGNDGIRIRPKTRDIVITGNLDCGPRAPNAHQDGVQHQAGERITWVDFQVGGDWNGNTSTCQGAAGAFDVSCISDNCNTPTDITILRSKITACNHAINMGTSLRLTVKDSFARQGNPADEADGLCNVQVGFACHTDGSAQDLMVDNLSCDHFPYGNGGIWPTDG